MDEMKLKLSTSFMKNMLAKIIRKVIKKKYGVDVNITINDLKIELINRRASIHLDVDADMSQNDLMGVLNSITEDS